MYSLVSNHVYNIDHFILVLLLLSLVLEVGWIALVTDVILMFYVSSLLSSRGSLFVRMLAALGGESRTMILVINIVHG